MRLRTFAIGAAVFLAGCATGSRTIFTPPPAAERIGDYRAIEGRGPEVVAELRAAPAPAEPLAVDGKSYDADQKRLGAQGMMPIGTSHFDVTDADARQDALRQGRNVGADQVVFYAPAGGGAGEMLVAYYVRFKLPFGATFRDLNATEKQALKSGGVRIGSVVDGTPASKANLLGGDMIVSLNGKAVANRGEFQALLRANAGRTVTLGVVRNGESLDRMVRLGLVPTASAR
jgi:hypothetical protein